MNWFLSLHLIFREKIHFLYLYSLKYFPLFYYVLQEIHTSNFHVNFQFLGLDFIEIKCSAGKLIYSHSYNFFFYY